MNELVKKCNFWNVTFLCTKFIPHNSHILRTNITFGWNTIFLKDYHCLLTQQSPGYEQSIINKKFGEKKFEMIKNYQNKQKQGNTRKFLHIITTIVVKWIKPGNWWWKQRSVQQWWDQLQSGDQLQSQIARGICPNKYFWLIQWIENPFNKNLWSKTAPQYWWCRKVSILPGTWSPVIIVWMKRNGPKLMLLWLIDQWYIDIIWQK